MKLPFDAAQFESVFVQYHEAVWPMPLVLIGAALACVGLLFCAQPWASRLISLLLAGLWLWTALAYHFAHFAQINPAAWWFGILFLLGATAFDWYGVVDDRLRFSTSRDLWGLTGAVLILFALVVYPILGYAEGRRYPAAPTFGLPCPTTIFTIGMLLFARAPAPRAVFIVPILWSAIGALAALWLDIAEDIWLLAAGAAAVAAVFFLHSPTDLAVRSTAPRTVRPREG